MGIFFKSPNIHAPEKVRWKKFANRTQGNRAVGGHLYLTQSRLIFEPNRMDAMLNGQSWSASLTSITTVGTDAPNGNVLSGGLRTRLKLDLEDGRSEYFVVNGVQEVVEVITEAARG